MLQGKFEFICAKGDIADYLQKRKFTCVYLDREAPSPGEGEGPPVKKVFIGGDVRTASHSAVPSPGQAATPEQAIKGDNESNPKNEPNLSGGGGQLRAASHSMTGLSSPPKEDHAMSSTESAARSLQQMSADVDLMNPAGRSRATSQSGPDEEAVIYPQSRMLQDPTGRLLYVGDAATLAFLQLLRLMVDSVAGPSPFTTDPRRHKIVEAQLSIPSNARFTHLLPDKQTAYVLVDAFFVNTQGLLQLFDRQKFFVQLETCYADPLLTDASWLCVFNLICAIGLMLGTPKSSSPDYHTIEKLRNEPLDRAEIFYLNARALNDPTTGIEDADFWSIQALILMSFYMMAKSKRNAAFALIGQLSFPFYWIISIKFYMVSVTVAQRQVNLHPFCFPICRMPSATKEKE
jgi:hypothetical protein